MTDPRPSFETINAYVDGELAADAAAAVARALAHDRSLAEQVATLSRLKAAVQETCDDVELALPPAPQPRQWAPAVAACIGLVAFLLGSVAVDIATRPGPPAWLGEAWRLHAAWSQEEIPPSSGVDAGLFLTSLSGFDDEVLVPDLTAASLSLAHLDSHPGPTAAKALHLGYLGTRGCRISFFVLPEALDLPRRFTTYDQDRNRAHGWRERATGYLLLNQGMPTVRFDLLARSLHRIIRENAPLAPETREALARSRQESPPCLS